MVTTMLIHILSNEKGIHTLKPSQHKEYWRHN